MDSTERLVQTWVASGRTDEVDQIVSDITHGGVKVLDLIKALKEYLTSEEDGLRTKGVELLSLVLSKAPAPVLNRQSVRVLSAFYSDKLDDSATIVPALGGLVSLAASDGCSSNEATVIVDALFAHVNMKALVQSVRFLVFSIIDTLMARHRDALKSPELSFLKGYIALAEGEKDPRNLLLAFAIARVILIEFHIVNHVEALFNITYCYFPITFRPPPNDPYGITTDDLKSALRSCLNATPLFGSMAIPVFLEKLAAGSPATKRDTLQAMSACLPVFGAALARSFARKLWSSLKLEIFQPTDPITEQEALATTQVLINTIYVSEDTSTYDNEDIQGLARDACEECIKILREPEKSQAKPAIKVICAFMSTTASVSKYTISQVVPHLTKLFLDPDEISNRPSVLALLADIIAAARDSSTLKKAGNITPLAQFKDELLGVMTVGLKTSSTRRPALHGLKAMVTTTGPLLTDEELAFVVHSVNDILQADPDDVDDAIDLVLDLLSTVSDVTSRHVEEQTLPLLFSSLPDRAPTRDATTERSKYWRVLSALGVLCRQAELFETFIIRLTTKLDLLCLPATLPSEGEDLEPTAAYAHSILTTISKTLTVKVEMKHADVPKYIDRLVPRLYNLFIFSATSPVGRYLVGTDPRLVIVAGQIITSVAQTISLQKQELFSAALFSAYFAGNIKPLAEGQQNIPHETPFRPFQTSATSLERNLVLLFSAATTTFHKELAIPDEDLAAFLSTMVAWSLDEAANGLQREAARHSIGSILNKHVDEVSPFLDDMLNSYWMREIKNTAASSERRREAIKTWIWVSKALLVRNHPSAKQFTDQLFDIFDDDEVNWDAARAIGEIAHSDVVLTKQNHAVTKILYAQRFFNRLLPRIMSGAKDTTNSHQQIAHLVALASLIKSIPKTTYAHQLPSLIPLLLRGLELPDINIRANVIDTFLAAADGDSPDQGIISEHASTLVSIMLKNSLVEEMPSVRVRVSALKYLGVLPSIIRYDVLHPYKSNVLKELSRVLDDPKRSVRKEAVDARTNWFKYNG